MAKNKVDKNSPEYKRQLAKVVAIVFVLTAGGGYLLAQKIVQAEAAYETVHGKPAQAKKSHKP